MRNTSLYNVLFKLLDEFELTFKDCHGILKSDYNDIASVTGYRIII